MVKSPTTDQGTCLDHVYYNGALNGIVVEVADTYYSDHDTVLVSIPVVAKRLPVCPIDGESKRRKVVDVLQDSPILVSIAKPNSTKSFSENNPVINTIVVPPVQQVESWPQFRFYQVNEEWQRRLCSQLGLPYCLPYNSTRGSSETVLTTPDRQTVLEMMRDGNCLFRSMSCVLTGSQDYYMLVRLLVCNHMYSILHLLLPHIHPHTSVEAYIAHMNMERDYIWGTDVEIFTFANLCQTNVYVYSIQQKCWCVFSPSCSLRNLDVSIESVYFIHLVNHYEVVTSVL